MKRSESVLIISFLIQAHWTNIYTKRRCYLLDEDCHKNWYKKALQEDQTEGYIRLTWPWFHHMTK